MRLPLDPTVSYQWYKDGIALIGETDAQISQVYGEGDYQVRIDDGTDCRISVKYEHRVPIINATQFKTICENEVYTFGSQLLTSTGTYVETFSSADQCDSIVSLHLKVLGTEWDGQQAGTPVNAGVYIYMAKIRMNDGVERQFAGSVTVVK